MRTTFEIISDDQIEVVHGNANFGGMSKRAVVNEGVIKYAIGYTGGSTQVAILLEHGLIRKPRNHGYRSDLTEKGKEYARAVLSAVRISQILEFATTEGAE